ncbi:MAG TPA: hypothetical protein VHS97_01160, partial [Isosphaeraceae bacterium]|nr:hypothetical protein [Isosphaeraceae bacterium]
PGHERRNLAELNRMERKDSRTTVRQTMPPPEPRNGVKLGRPTPIQDDTSMVPRVPAGAAARSRGATTSPLEALVTPPLPVSPDNSATQPASGTWAQANLFQIER